MSLEITLGIFFSRRHGLFLLAYFLSDCQAGSQNSLLYWPLFYCQWCSNSMGYTEDRVDLQFWEIQGQGLHLGTMFLLVMSYRALHGNKSCVYVCVSMFVSFDFSLLMKLAGFIEGTGP